MDKYSSDNFKVVVENFDLDTPIFYENIHDQPNFSYLTWRMQSGSKAYNFKELGESYLAGCLVMLDSALQDNTHRLGDAVIYPVIFNAFHGVELYLKAFLFELEDANSESAWGHDVKSLLKEVKESAEKNALTNFVCEDLCYLEKYLNEILKYTEDTTFPRYPNNRHGSEQFFVESAKNIIVAMDALRKWIQSVFYILDRNFVNLYFRERQ